MRWLKKQPAGPVERLVAIKSRLASLPAKHPAHAVAVGPGVAQAEEQIPIICRNIDDAMAALQTGRDPAGHSIEPWQVGKGLEHLVGDITGPGFSGLMLVALSADGVTELERGIEDLAAVASDLQATERERKKAYLEDVLGGALSARLIGDVGPETAEAVTTTAVAKARARWSRFNDYESLSDEKKAEARSEFERTGTPTVAGRAVAMSAFMARQEIADADYQDMLLQAQAQDNPEETIRFISRFVAEKIAGDAAREALRQAGMTQDGDLFLDFGARILLLLIPMRVG
jgi:hypothetical protein